MKGDTGCLETRGKECCWAGKKNLEMWHFVACAVHCGSSSETEPEGCVVD